jgi:hypothetical protein
MVPTVIDLLKARAVQDDELGMALVTLGLLSFVRFLCGYTIPAVSDVQRTFSCDLIIANIIYRTDTTSTLMEIINSSHSDDNAVLSIWCLNRICRSAELAAALIKQNVVATLLKGLNGSRTSARLSAWCLGSLVYTNDLAETLASYDVIPASAEYLRGCTGELNVEPGDICAGLFLVARMARTIPLSRALERAGCVPFVVHHLSTSEHAQVLNWSARAVGCLLRPNALDLAKNLLEVGTAKALARLPHVLQAEEIEPLSSFAFAIHRFSVAEWGAGTRKALVDAGVVDSLLSALRTAADVLYPQVLIELALAVSALVDIGGASIRKEIVRAGGVEILQRVGAKGLPEVEKACNIAVTSITGNFWTRHAGRPCLWHRDTHNAYNADVAQRLQRRQWLTPGTAAARSTNRHVLRRWHIDHRGQPRLRYCSFLSTRIPASHTCTYSTLQIDCNEVMYWSLTVTFPLTLWHTFRDLSLYQPLQLHCTISYAKF